MGRIEKEWSAKNCEPQDKILEGVLGEFKKNINNKDNACIEEIILICKRSNIRHDYSLQLVCTNFPSGIPHTYIRKGQQVKIRFVKSEVAAYNTRIWPEEILNMGAKNDWLPQEEVICLYSGKIYDKKNWSDYTK